MAIYNICGYCYKSLETFAIYPAQFIGVFWLLVAFILLLLELSTPGLFLFISFAAGCISASCAAFAGYSLVMQCIISLISITLSFIFIRIWAKKRILNSFKSNVDGLIGKQAIVTQELSTTQIGYVKIQGEEWPAINETITLPIQKGTLVTIVALRGNKLVVTQEIK